MRSEEECVCSESNCCDTEQRSASQPASQPVVKEMPSSVASGTQCISDTGYHKYGETY